MLLLLLCYNIKELFLYLFFSYLGSDRDFSGCEVQAWKALVGNLKITSNKRDPSADWY